MMEGDKTQDDWSQLLANRVALITGGGSGIGRATVERFLREGAAVVTIDIDPHIEHLAAEFGERCSAVIGDASDEADLDRAFAAADALGRLDVLVANVGKGIEADVVETTLAQWAKVVDETLTVAYLAGNRAVARMRTQRGGAIVNVGSVQGMRGYPKHAAYAASKAGLLGLTRQMATDFGPEGIRVNAVCPGTIVTEGVRRWLKSFPDPRAREAEFSRWPSLRRVGRADEVAAAILWLACDESSFVTGHSLVVDGGMISVGHHSEPPVALS